MHTLEQELKQIAHELQQGQVEPSARRIQNLIGLIEGQGLVLVQVRTMQQRRAGTPYVTGDMVYLEREEAGGAA